MRINQSGVLPTQPSNPHIYTRKQPPNAPALSARTLTLLVNRSPSSFSLLSTRIHGLEDRGACHLSPAGKKYASSPVPKLVG